MLRVTEEFIFISNNESFPNGFFRILPKYNYSRNGDRRRTDITLESVTVNGEEKPYHCLLYTSCRRNSVARDMRSGAPKKR